jgi:hypothetical protein
VVCNADEGEPGTFKDRVLLSSYADLVFDGMSVAGLTIGASKGLLYLRGEYAYLLPALRANLAQRRRAACWESRCAARRVVTSRSTSISVPAPTSAARNRRCSSRSKASAACRGFARLSRSPSVIAASRRW